MLLRAADLIGHRRSASPAQANALYYVFEGVGMNRQLGYASPSVFTDLYPQLF